MYRGKPSSGYEVLRNIFEFIPLLRGQFQKFWDCENAVEVSFFSRPMPPRGVCQAHRSPGEDRLGSRPAPRRPSRKLFQGWEVFQQRNCGGLNRKVDLAIRKAYGFKTLKIAKELFINNLRNFPFQSLPKDFGEEA